jgi:hypothetical protein
MEYPVPKIGTQDEYLILLNGEDSFQTGASVPESPRTRMREGLA